MKSLFAKLLSLFSAAEPVTVDYLTGKELGDPFRPLKAVETRFPAVKEMLTGAEADAMEEIHEFAGYLEDIIARRFEAGAARDAALHKLEEFALWAGKAIVK